MKLIRPNMDLVRRASSEFQDANARVEAALTLLFTTFPKNSDIGSVLAKTTVLNRLYSTGILDVISAAQHVLDKNIDEELAARSPKVVPAVARMRLGGKERNQYSFATKYCSWHFPDAYPIYDSQVDRCLMAYKRQDSHFNFKQDDLSDYPTFVAIMDDFRRHYELKCTYKELDSLLWKTGAELAIALGRSAAE